LSCLAAVALAAPALAEEPRPKTIYELFGVQEPGLRGPELEAAVKAAETFPLGSEKNPVRARGISGERAYLASLRCSDGKAPDILGRGIGTPSPFGGVTDIYGVACKGAEPATASIAIDMYHDWIEVRPVPGFTFARR
jgi:hypothetical protein